MSDFDVVTQGNPLYAEIERLKREIATMRAQHKLHACAGESIADTQVRLYSAACRYERERDALADALRETLDEAIGWFDYACGYQEGDEHKQSVLAFVLKARAALAQVRK